jgi:hypothetical protein
MVEHSDTHYKLAYSNKALNPEGLLSGWMVVSGILLTTSLLFYNMARNKSVNVKPFLAKLISVGLIIVSTIYMCSALYLYSKRMNFALKDCTKHTRCSEHQFKDIQFLKYTYIFLGILTLLIKAVIVFLVLVNI